MTSNKSRAWTAVVIFALLAVATTAWLWYDNNQQQAKNDTETNQTTNTPSTNDNQTPSTTKKDSNTVNIVDRAFSPTSITIKKGQTVTWTNNDNVDHSVVADDASNTGGIPTDVQLFGPGETFSVTFNKVGTFHYHCIPHTFMTASVEVTD